MGLINDGKTMVTAHVNESTEFIYLSRDIIVITVIDTIVNISIILVRECQRSLFYRAISYVIYIYIVLNYTHMLHGAGIFTYITG